MSRKLVLALLLVLSGALFAGEVRSYAPPPDTPVIPWTRFNIQYAVRIVGSGGPTKVMFYMTTDGGRTWRLYGEDKDLKSPMVIKVPGEGTYGFATVISTKLRKAYPPRPGTRPDRFVIVDRTPPTARWISPGMGEISLNANGSVALAWEAADQHLGLTPVSLEYSTDGGNFWLPLREKLPAKGSINWTPPLLEGENEIMLRLIAADLAGNKRIVKNRARFSIDRQPPTVSILGPRMAGGYEFDVDYRATDDQSGIGQVELYYTVNDGNEWFFFDSDKDLSKQSMKFNSPSARRVGLYLVAVDKRGNRTAPPAKGARPMLDVELDLQAPQVTILPPFSSTNTVIGKTQPTQIRWSASDVNIKENSAKVELSTNGGNSWTALASGLPSNGSYTWTPDLQSDNVLIRVTVDDQMGNRGTALSMPFRVDEKRPETTINDVKPIAPGSTNIPAAGGNVWAPQIPGSTTPAQPTQPSSGSDVSVPGAYDPMAAINPSAQQPTQPVAPVDTPVAPVTPTEPAKPADIDIPGTIPGMSDLSGTGAPVAKTPEQPAAVAPIDTTMPTIDMPKPIDAPKPVDAPGTVTPPPAVPSVDQGSDISIPPIPGQGGSTDIKPIDSAIPSIGGTGDTAIPPMNDKIPEVPSIGGTDGNLDLNSIGKTPAQPNVKPQAPAVAPVGKNSEQLLEQAEQAYASGNEQDKALRLAREALDTDPNNARGYALIASIYTEKQKFEDAINNAQRAVQLAPTESRYQQILGYAQYARANSINNAIRAKRIPASQVRRFTAQIVQSLEDSQKAYEKMLSSTDRSDVKEAYYRLGQIDYFRATRVLRDDELAAASLRKSIANYEKSYSINSPQYREVLQIGICYYRLNDYDQAERWLVKAQELSSTSRPPKEAFFYLAMIHEKMERPEEALPFWEKVAALYPTGSKYQQLANSRVNALKKMINP